MSWGKILQSILQIVGLGMQNARDSELKADGARKAELERRDELDAVKERADEHRKKTADADAANVAKRL